MKKVVTILLMILALNCNAQYRYNRPRDNQIEAKAGMVVLVGTFIAVESMKFEQSDYFTPGFQVRSRQKELVAFTGMVTAVATVYAVKYIKQHGKKQIHRRKVNRCQMINRKRR